MLLAYVFQLKNGARHPRNKLVQLRLGLLLAISYSSTFAGDRLLRLGKLKIVAQLYSLEMLILIETAAYISLGKLDTSLLYTIHINNDLLL